MQLAGKRKSSSQNIFTWLGILVVVVMVLGAVVPSSIGTNSGTSSLKTPTAKAITSDSQKSVTSLEQALQKDPTDKTGWLNLGTAYLNAGQFEKAITSFQKALDIDPNLIEAHYDLGLALAQNQPSDVQGALEQWQVVVKLESTSTWAQKAQQQIDIYQQNK